jgi:hypothetical protein
VNKRDEDKSKEHTSVHKLIPKCILTVIIVPTVKVKSVCGWVMTVMDIRYFSIYFLISFLFIYKVENSTRYLSKFLLRIYLDFPELFLLSNDSISRTMIVLTWTQAFVFPTMPYSVITIVAMLTYQSVGGCVYRSAWECLTICFFIISYSNIVINTQTFRYLVGYLPVKSTIELLAN